MKRHLLHDSFEEIPLKKSPMAPKASKPMKRSNAAKNSEGPVKKRKVKTSDHDWLLIDL